MSKPTSPGVQEERRKLFKLLERLDDVDPKCIPTIFADQWAIGDPEARQKIEEAIDRLPKRKKSN